MPVSARLFARLASVGTSRSVAALALLFWMYRFCSDPVYERVRLPGERELVIASEPDFCDPRCSDTYEITEDDEVLVPATAFASGGFGPNRPLLHAASSDGRWVALFSPDKHVDINEQSDFSRLGALIERRGILMIHDLESGQRWAEANYAIERTEPDELLGEARSTSDLSTGLESLALPRRVTSATVEGIPETLGAILSALATLPALETLQLYDVKLDRAGLRALAELRAVRTIHMEGVEAPDEIAAVIDGLPRLEALSMHRCRFGADAARRLRARCPQCRVYADSDPPEL